jgi:hypothetical protein
LGKLLLAVAVADDAVSIKVDLRALHRMLALPTVSDDARLELSAPASKTRQGKATRLVPTDPACAQHLPDTRLVALLAEAHATRDLVLASPHRSLREIAGEQGRCRHRMAKLIRLAWLSPKIAGAIVEGRQPARLNSRRLVESDIPLRWDQQEYMLEVG